VSELEDGSHFGFLCWSYSATGRGQISSGNTKIFLFVTILDTNHLAQKVAILGAKNPLNFNRGRNLAAFAREIETAAIRRNPLDFLRHSVP
jgi:hypothetical protein